AGDHQPQSMATVAHAGDGCGAASCRGGKGELRFFRRSPASNGKGADWSVVVQRLIGAGHNPCAVRDYSLGQIEAYLAAIDHEARERHRMALIVARAAQADGKHFKKILRELD